MFLLDPTTTEQYLRERNHLDPQETVRVSELSGGVSNQVLLVERSRGDRFVLKQAREQLRVQQEWKCDVKRIWREMDVLRICGEVLAKVGQASPPAIQVSVPEILFEDRENYCYAMTAAPEGHRTWKEQLLSGLTDPHIADCAGQLLGTLHAATWQNQRVAEMLDDRSYFEALRVDPYYRRVATVRPELRSDVDQLIEYLRLHRWCLVHGDFSPKNLLISDRKVVLIDFEVGHYGDPAFDIGFFLTHLVLKGIRAGRNYGELLYLIRRWWTAYCDCLATVAGANLLGVQRRASLNLAACLWARLDGKSPVDYLSNSERVRGRDLAKILIGNVSLDSSLRDVDRCLARHDCIGGAYGREVLDSRGKPTVQAEIWSPFLEHRMMLGTAMVPSGASTGRAEAFEMRDLDAGWYDGQGVRGAIFQMNRREILPLQKLDPIDQQAVDHRLLECDPTPQKTFLGGNVILAVSLAVAHAGANVRGIPLWMHLHHCFRIEAEARGQAIPAPKMPLPMVNMISGGKHAGGNLDFQDILIQPVGTSDYPMQLEWIVRVYRRLSKLLIEAGYEGYLVGDEGGFGPRLKSNREAVELVVRAIEAAKLRPGDDVNIAIDVASSHFYRDGRYHLAAEQGRALTSSEMIDRLEEWADAFPIASIEDGLAEDDWDGWRELTKRLGSRVKLVGDDLFATNEARVKRGIELGCGNSVLVKVNQIGTLTETFRTMLTAMSAGYTRVVSARSGETEDTTIADLAVGCGAESIKIGSIVRSERLAKYNRLLRIAEQLAS
jgi:enolase